VLVIEGSIPNEKINGDGYWTSFGNDEATGEPLTINHWVDQLAPKAWGVIAVGTCATYGGIHAMAGNPTGCMGLADYLGWDFRSAGGLPIVNVPGCPVQPDNFMETVAWLLYQAAGLAPVIPLDAQLRPTWLFGKTVPRGLRPRRLLRAGRLRQGLQLAQVPGEDRLLGAGRQLQRPQARLDGRDRRLPQRGRHLHRVHDAGLPRQVHAVHGRAAGGRPVLDAVRRLRAAGPPAAQHHEPHREQRDEVAAQPRRAHHGLPAPVAELRGDRAMATRERVKPEAGNVVDMSWDPITRIVGNLGIYTKIDFNQREVVSCKSTSSIFRGYSVFMRGKDPRDAHFITSRICGICGDNHAVCSQYAQNMAYGVKTPPLGEWIVNLGEAAEYVFDHTIFQDNLVFVDFCEQMVRDTNPSVMEKAEKAEAPHAEIHGFRTIADIMRLVQPVHRVDVPRGAHDEPPHAGDDLPHGGAPRAPRPRSIPAGSGPRPRRSSSRTTCRGCCAAWTSSRRPSR
jgi:hypothetical protein